MLWILFPLTWCEFYHSDPNSKAERTWVRPHVYHLVFNNKYSLMVTEIRPFQHNNGYISPHPKDKNTHFSNGVSFEESSAPYSEHIWKHPNYKRHISCSHMVCKFFYLKSNENNKFRSLKCYFYHCVDIVNFLLQIAQVQEPIKDFVWGHSRQTTWFSHKGIKRNYKHKFETYFDKAGRYATAYAASLGSL